MKPNQIKLLKDRLLQFPSIIAVTASHGVPGSIKSRSGETENGKHIHYNNINCDTSFFTTFKIPVMYGRNFLPGDSGKGWIVNERMVKEIESKEEFPSRIRNHIIIGVVEDFNTSSLHTGMDAVAIELSSEGLCDLSLRISSINVPQTIKILQDTWKETCPEFNCDYEFFDDMIASQYDNEKHLAQAIGSISLLAVFISWLGLFGLVLYTISKRTKEIGIRVVNGATAGQILVLLNREFLKWILIAYLIACPVAYYAMNKWLQGFAYKTTLNWWVFALTGIIAFFIAIITISWQTWIAARRNPVESLRYE
jgi:putative ABC transport system permease protein